MGKGQRFKDAGYTTPKHLLEIAIGITIIEKIISSFNGNPVYIGCRPEYVDEIKRIVKEGEYNVYIYSFNNEVLSPVKTVWKVLDHIYQDNQPVVVHYCDVFLPGGIDLWYCEKSIYPFLEHPDSGMVLFDSQDKRFDRDWIFNKAIGGVYWFRNKRELIVRIKSKPNAKTMGEIVQSGDYGMLEVEQIDIGTPEDYKKYLEEHPW